jgi:hypothetical protein
LLEIEKTDHSMITELPGRVTRRQPFWCAKVGQPGRGSAGEIFRSANTSRNALGRASSLAVALFGAVFDPIPAIRRNNAQVRAFTRTVGARAVVGAKVALFARIDYAVATLKLAMIVAQATGSSIV